MFTKTYIEIRENTDVEFWHNLPEIKSWIEPFEQQCIIDGLLISITNDISADGLTFTRISTFPSEAAYTALINNSPDLEYQNHRSAYNRACSRIWFNTDGYAA